jgi:SAM-dependent methyltransferase
VVVSTLSMHHWADPSTALAEISRVLRPGGRVLVWDFRPGHRARPHPFGSAHVRVPDPADHLEGSGLHAVSATAWRWPWRLALIQRSELIPSDEA